MSILIKFIFLLVGVILVNSKDEDDFGLDQYPFMVSIRNVSGKHLCTGYIVRDEWILTSAHYVLNRAPSEINIQHAVKKFSPTGGNIVNVTKIIIHKNFDPKDFANRIALIKLNNSLEFDENTQPVKMPPKNYYISVYTKCLHVAWNSNEKEMQEFEVKTITDMECNRHYGLGIEFTNICAKKVSRGIEPCVSSGGASLLFNGILLGIQSFISLSCDHFKNPFGYTEISHHIDWIFETINTYEYNKFLNLTSYNPSCKMIELGSDENPIYMCTHPTRIDGGYYI